MLSCAEPSIQLVPQDQLEAATENAIQLSRMCSIYTHASKLSSIIIYLKARLKEHHQVSLMYSLCKCLEFAMCLTLSVVVDKVFHTGEFSNNRDCISLIPRIVLGLACFDRADIWLPILSCGFAVSRYQ